MKFVAVQIDATPIGINELVIYHWIDRQSFNEFAQFLL